VRSETIIHGWLQSILMTTVTLGMTKVQLSQENSLFRFRNKSEIVNSRSANLCEIRLQINLIFGVAVMQSAKPARIPKRYESPTLKKLKPEDAKQFLVHHANMGDSGAQEILALLLPANKNSGD
jgi:hypothetical protein